jgi:sulfur carrier protein ThiS adenylyltransferase
MTFSEIRQKASNYKIGIAGCGGLGSNCSSMLVRSGITQLVLVDYDIIQESNLNRQFFFYEQLGKLKTEMLKENLIKINSATNIITHNAKLDPNNIDKYFSDCDIIVEAFDNAESKQMLIEVVQNKYPEKHLICVSGIGGLFDAEKIKIIRNGKLIMIGDFKADVSETNPPLAPKVTIAAALQANEVLNIICSQK